MKNITLIILLTATSIISQAQNLTKYVNPFIGTGGNGHTFPNACLPFGMMQMGPVTNNVGWDWVSGYHYSDSTIMGFSHTRLSGTGIGDLSDWLFMPRIGAFTINWGSNEKPFPSWRSRFSHADEVASPGYYSVLLKDTKIKAEFTASEHCALHRYTFPASDSAHIIIAPSVDISTYIGSMASIPWSSMKWENDSTISGFRISFGWVPFRRVYMVARFSKPFFTYQMTSGSKPGWLVREKEHNFLIGSVYFKTKEREQITVKVGISAVSLDNASANLSAELFDKNFEQVHTLAVEAWNKELNKIQIEADDKTKQIFYTAMYHAIIQPNSIADVDGRYRGADFEIATSKTGKYYSTLSLWDTFRAVHPLYSIIQPTINSEIIQSMITHQQVTGILPIWTLWGAENYCMIGNHSIPVITNAILTDAKGFDYEEAFTTMKATSTTIHKGSDWDIYNKYGYLPKDLVGESVSKTLEICFNDWCVAQVAKKLSKTTDYEFFMKRSQSYKQLYNAQSDFFQPKDKNGNWSSPFNPIDAKYSNSFTEANAWQYRWSVQHDIPSLIELTGGKAKFEAKLDTLFTMSSEVIGGQRDISGLIGQYVHGNEPSHHVAYLFNYAGQPAKTQKWLTKIRTEMYSNQPDGYAGNEDCGQMSAWYILTTLGFYPVNPANGVFDIGRPFVKEANINLENGKTFTIKASNLSDKNTFVKKVSLNGKVIKNYKLNYADIMAGGELVFEMGK
jgi:predicted alpha-1,2-mannosidase